MTESALATKRLADPTDAAFRQTILGGSDAAAAAGVSPWVTAMDRWMVYTGRLEPREVGEAAELGNDMEPALLRRYAIRSGYHVLCRDWWGDPIVWTPDGDQLDPPPPEVPVHLIDTVRDPQHVDPRDGHLWRVCHLDGVAFDLARSGWTPVRWVEGKTAGRVDPEKWGEDGTDHVPDDYLCQAHHNGHVVERAHGLILPVDIPLLVGGYGGHKVRIFTVHPDAGFRADLEALEADFWSRVVHDVPPLAEYTERGRESLARLHPEDDGGERLVAPESPIHQLGIEAAEADAIYKQAKADRAAAFARLQEEQGDTKRLIGSGWKTSWPLVRPKPKTDWEAVARALAKDVGDPELLARLEREHQVAQKPYRRFLLTASLEG